MFGVPLAAAWPIGHNIVMNITSARYFWFYYFTPAGRGAGGGI